MSRGTFKENTSFQEAHSNSWMVFRNPELPANLVALFDEVGREARPDRFWEMAAALKAFYEERGALPLDPTIPDMHCSTSSFVQLQKVYHEKAREDREAIRQRIAIEEGELAYWIKNASDLQHIHFRQVEQEAAQPQLQEYQENDNYKWGIVTKAAIAYEALHHCRPTQQDTLHALVQEILSKVEGPF